MNEKISGETRPAACVITGSSRGLALRLVQDALAQGRIVATCSR